MNLVSALAIPFCLSLSLLGCLSLPSMLLAERLLPSAASLEVPTPTLSMVEIDALYQYFEDDGIQTIEDRTRLEMNGALWQERFIDGNRLERGYGPDGVYVVGPKGRLALSEEMARSIRNYQCLRQLEFLVACAGMELRETIGNNGQRTLVAWQNDELFARLEFDPDSEHLATIEYRSTLLDDEESPGLTKTRFRDYQMVDGLPLPHRIETTRDGSLSSIYSVVSYRLTFWSDR